MEKALCLLLRTAGARATTAAAAPLPAPTTQFNLRFRLRISTITVVIPDVIVIIIITTTIDATLHLTCSSANQLDDHLGAGMQRVFDVALNDVLMAVADFRHSCALRGIQQPRWRWQMFRISMLAVLAIVAILLEFWRSPSLLGFASELVELIIQLFERHGVFLVL